jgi:hypothetical protein
MRKKITLPITKTKVTVDDSEYVYLGETIVAEHKDGSFNLGIYEHVAIDNPNLKKVWKIVPEKKLTRVSLTYRIKKLWYRVVWIFIKLFMKRTIMRHKFQINAGISSIEQTHFIYAKKAGVGFGNFFGTGLFSQPKANVVKKKVINKNKK